MLDSPPEPDDTITDVQGQRQQFDTKYAALYYPWLTIPDPFPANLADIHDYPIPPTGHMLGVYARTDIERGVHKAPANEVVRGDHRPAPQAQQGASRTSSTRTRSTST